MNTDIASDGDSRGCPCACASQKKSDKEVSVCGHCIMPSPLDNDDFQIDIVQGGYEEGYRVEVSEDNR